MLDWDIRASFVFMDSISESLYVKRYRKCSSTSYFIKSSSTLKDPLVLSSSRVSRSFYAARSKFVLSMFMISWALSLASTFIKSFFSLSSSYLS